MESRPEQGIGSDAESAAAEKAALRRDQRHIDFVAKALAQHRAQIADRVDQPETKRAAAGPIFAGEQRLLGAVELAGAARLHQRDEIVVDLALQVLEPFDVARILRQKWIEHRLVLAGGIEPAFD